MPARAINQIKVLKPSPEFYKLKQDSKNLEAPISKTILPKFALPLSAEINLLNEAEYSNSDGWSIYSLKIKAQDALNLSVQFSEFRLSVNSLLSIYNQSELTDSITANENNITGTWRTRTYGGNLLNIVLKLPTEEVAQTKLKIGAVYWGYKEFDGRFGSPGASEYCNINVACPLGTGWETQRNAVAIIQAPNGYASGVLVMNTCGTNIPYLLTAKHVIDQGGGPLTNWLFQFFYYSTDCNTNTGYREDVQFSGAQLRANYGPSDFALLQLLQTPANSGIYYAGWNRNINLPFTHATGIHHPNHDVMKISSSNNFVQRFAGGGYDPNSHWQVVWSQGITASGSSGSPLFDVGHRIIGQLHDGLSNCATPNGTDWYGSFDISWTGGGTNSTRLSNWLDPSNSNAMTTNTTNISSLIPTTFTISGPSVFCTATSTAYSIPGLPPGATVVWSISPSGIATINTPNATQTTLTRIFDGVITLTANISNICGLAPAQINKPNITLGLGNSINFTQKTITCVNSKPYFYGAVATVPSATNYAWYAKDESNQNNPFVLKQSENSNTADFPLGNNHGDRYYTIRVVVTNPCGNKHQ